MKLHEHIKELRETRNIPQEAVAYDLGMSQSQYSRREKGEVNFLAKEITIIATALGVEVAEIYGVEGSEINSSDQKEGSSGKFENIFYLPEKLIEQFERRIREKDEVIYLLKNEIQELKRKEA